MSGLVASEKRLAFVPNRSNLVVVAKAKEMILRMMDLLLEIIPPWSWVECRVLLDGNQTKCLPMMMKFMGFGNATMNTKTNMQVRGGGIPSGI